MKEIRTGKAPAPVGPYSQAIESDGWLFVSGQIPLDPESGDVVAGNTVDQARQCLENLRAVLTAAGGSLDDAVKMTMWLKNGTQEIFSDAAKSINCNIHVLSLNLLPGIYFFNNS